MVNFKMCHCNICMTNDDFDGVKSRWLCLRLLNDIQYIVRQNAIYLGVVNRTNVYVRQSKSAKYARQQIIAFNLNCSQNSEWMHNDKERKQRRTYTVDLKLNAMHERNVIVRLLTLLNIDIKLNRKRESSMRALTVEALGSGGGKSMNWEQKHNDEGNEIALRSHALNQEMLGQNANKKLNWQIVGMLHFSISNYTTCTRTRTHFISKIAAITLFRLQLIGNVFYVTVNCQNFVEIMNEKNCSGFYERYTEPSPSCIVICSLSMAKQPLTVTIIWKSHDSQSRHTHGMGFLSILRSNTFQQRTVHAYTIRSLGTHK